MCPFPISEKHQIVLPFSSGALPLTARPHSLRLARASAVGRSQPKLDIHARRGEVFAASAKSSPKAAVQQAVADLAEAASGTSDREAQQAAAAKL